MEGYTLYGVFRASRDERVSARRREAGADGDLAKTWQFQPPQPTRLPDRIMTVRLTL